MSEGVFCMIQNHIKRKCALRAQILHAGWNGLEWIMLLPSPWLRFHLPYECEHISQNIDLQRRLNGFFPSDMCLLFFCALSTLRFGGSALEESQQESGEVDAICSLCSTHAPHRYGYTTCNAFAAINASRMCKHIRTAKKRRVVLVLFGSRFCRTTFFFARLPSLPFSFLDESWNNFRRFCIVLILAFRRIDSNDFEKEKNNNFDEKR